ncbi:MAG TPA: flagellar export chaperone FliS [Planctomycetaceae bacterium]|nr:flagellar export chaperone FliS [Planctomycetaceae bacterium]
MLHGTDYRHTQVLTASPHRLHLMVVDGAIRHAVQAEQALAAGDFETAHAALGRSRDFVSELLAGLDGRQAPELVERLKGLFLFVYRNLVDADRRREPERVRDALKILEMHRETWLEAGRLPSSAAAGDVIQTGRSWMT